MDDPTMARKVGYVLDPKFLDHDTGPGHPERKERLQSIIKAIEQYKYKERLVQINARSATDEELLLVHTEAHLARIRRTQGCPRLHLDADTVASEDSYEIARLAAGAVLQLVDLIQGPEINCAFAFVRPPGHHAEPDRAMGFCLFNNVAIGAAYALKKYSLRRILIIDFDVHHGNGTEVAFYSDPQVLYISTHQYPLYPGTGHFSEAGAKAGAGFNLNFPLPAGTGDDDYNKIFETMIYPVAIEFAPELLLVSAGFDPYFDDPLAGMHVTPLGFRGIAHTVLKIAKECSRGRALFVLEGGYNLAGLAESSAAIFDEMLGTNDVELRWQSGQILESIRHQAKQHFSKYWSSLR